MESLNVKTWDKTYAEGRSLLVWPDENVVASLNRHKGQFDKGIDLACGAGRHAILMSEMGIESIGIDSSKASIEFAKQQSKSMGLENVEFINSLIQDVQFKKESFDIVIAWGLIHYLEKEDKKQFIEKVKSILKPNGMFLLTLRSTEDSRKNNGIEIESDRYLVDYFDKGTNRVKQTKMYFWDEEGVKNMLKGFSKIDLGHRIIEPIGSIGNRTAHWLVEAFK